MSDADEQCLSNINNTNEDDDSKDDRINKKIRSNSLSKYLNSRPRKFSDNLDEINEDIHENDLTISGRLEPDKYIGSKLIGDKQIKIAKSNHLKD
jgi:hypothetical protein